MYGVDVRGIPYWNIINLFCEDRIPILLLFVSSIEVILFMFNGYYY